MKKKLKPGPVPTLFNNFPPQKKKRRDNSTDRPHRGSSSSVFGCRALQFQKQPMGSYRKRKAARVRIADYLKLQCKCNPQITNVNLPCFFLSKSVADHEGGNCTVSCEYSVKGHEATGGAASLPWVQEASLSLCSKKYGCVPAQSAKAISSALSQEEDTDKG